MYRLRQKIVAQGLFVDFQGFPFQILNKEKIPQEKYILMKIDEFLLLK